MPVVKIIPFDLPLPQLLPTIEGNVDYQLFRDQLVRIDQLLLDPGLESRMLQADLEGWLARGKPVGAQAPPHRPSHPRRGFRS